MSLVSQRKAPKKKDNYWIWEMVTRFDNPSHYSTIRVIYIVVIVTYHFFNILCGPHHELFLLLMRRS